MTAGGGASAIEGGVKAIKFFVPAIIKTVESNTDACTRYEAGVTAIETKLDDADTALGTHETAVAATEATIALAVANQARLDAVEASLLTRFNFLTRLIAAEKKIAELMP